jgi:hypothetical protein
VGLLKNFFSPLRNRGGRGDRGYSRQLELSAEKTIHAHLRENSTLMERAVRLKARSERLEDSGIPSQSARIRAERARKDVQESLFSLREAFTRSTSDAEAGGRAFDRSLTRLHPEFAPARP